MLAKICVNMCQKSMFEMIRGMFLSVLCMRRGVGYLLKFSNEMCKYVCGSKNCEMLMRVVSFE